MKRDIDIDEMIKGIDFNATAVTSTTCDSPIKPLTMETLLEAKRLLQKGYTPVPVVNGWQVEMRILLGYQIRDFRERVFNIST